MNKELLITSILLVNPVANISANEFQAVKLRNLESRKELIGFSFSSKQILKRNFFIKNKETGEYEDVTIEYRVKLSFIQAVDGNYEYNGNGPLDYEVIVNDVDLNGNPIDFYDSTYFAKETGKNRYRLYNCDSTSYCTDIHRPHSDFSIVNTPYGMVIEMNTSKYMFEKSKGVKTFYQNTAQ
jgi:hypothetical protein